MKALSVPISERNILIGRSYDPVALEGMLLFLEALYEDLLRDIEQGGLEPIDAIKSELVEIARLRSHWLD